MRPACRLCKLYASCLRDRSAEEGTAGRDAVPAGPALKMGWASVERWDHPLHVMAALAIAKPTEFPNTDLEILRRSGL